MSNVPPKPKAERVRFEPCPIWMQETVTMARRYDRDVGVSQKGKFLYEEGVKPGKKYIWTTKNFR